MMPARRLASDMKKLPYEIDFKIAGDTHYVAFLRSVLTSISNEVGEDNFSDEIKRKCGLALVEAVNNAVHHAHKGDIYKPVGIKISVTVDEVEIIVIDYGKGFELHLAKLPDLQMVHGRGLYIIQSLMDEVSYKKGTDYNTMVLKCVKSKKIDLKP